MPPQWNPYEIPDAPGLPPLVADKSPLDDILAGIPAAPAQAQQSQAIPSDLLSVVPDLPAPPGAPVGKPQPVEPDQWGAIPEPPKRSVKPAPVESLYEIPAPPPLPADLAPDFSRSDYARSINAFDAPFSVDVAATTQRAQTAERNLQTFTQALRDAQADAVAIGEKLVPLEAQARTLDARIEELKGKKKRTPDEDRALSAAQVARKALAPQINELKPQQEAATSRFQAAQQQVQTAKQSAEMARQQADADLATVELEAERRGAAAQQAGAALFAKESQRIAQDARQQVAKIEAEETAARSRMDEDRKAYRDALKAGPAKQSMVLTVASVIAEALAARQSKRPPDFGRVLGQLEQATKAQFDERVQRQLSLIAEGEDSLSKAAQQKRVIEGQKAARLSEMLQSIETEIEVKKAGVRGTVDEAKLAMVQGDVRKLREGADAQALAAYQKEQAASEKSRLDRELQEAQIRKANAEAAEKEGEAARKAAGSGQPKEAAWSSRDPNKVYVPFTDTVLATFEGGNADKRAEKAGALVTDGFKYLKTLYEYEAMVEDYGSRRLLDKSGWTESDEYRKLATKHARLRTALAKVIAGQGFSTTESDNRAAEKMAPLPSAWNDTTRAALEQMRKDGNDDFRLTLNQAIDTKAQETLIREARRFGTSQTDIQRTLVANAPNVITNAKKPVDARLEAIGALSANVRKGITSEGEQAERDAILAELQEIRNATTVILQSEYDPEDPIGGVTDDAHEIVQALRKREAELRDLYRKVGSDNATKREQNRLENPKTPAALLESEGAIPSIR